jgi:hypothetical protein
MKRFTFAKCMRGFAVALICCAPYAYASAFKEADVGQTGSYALSHSIDGAKASVSITVIASKAKDKARPIGSFNSLAKLSITLSGRKLLIPKECKQQLLDVRYIRLENTVSRVQFWVQGGDGSESYQVAYTFAPNQPVKCQFLPDVNGAPFEPMVSQKTLQSISKGAKK